jgi:hypothetical protein
MDMFSGRQVKTPDSIDWPEVQKRDAQRQAVARSILTSGQIQSGREYQFAALLFQHSSDSGDLQTAHLLAVTAVAKGNGGARWLAAATFDRLMWNTNRPQVFGTQFKQVPGSESKWTMEPYEREALPDSVRTEWCVRPLSEQAAVLAALGKGQGAGSTSTAECK